MIHNDRNTLNFQNEKEKKKTRQSIQTTKIVMWYYHINRGGCGIFPTG